MMSIKNGSKTKADCHQVAKSTKRYAPQSLAG